MSGNGLDMHDSARLSRYDRLIRVISHSQQQRLWTEIRRSHGVAMQIRGGGGGRHTGPCNSLTSECSGLYELLILFWANGDRFFFVVPPHWALCARPTYSRGPRTRDCGEY